MDINSTNDVTEVENSRSLQLAKEMLLAACWRATLEVEQVTPQDHFGALGGDSIHALWIAGEVENFGLRLPEGALNRYPVLADLAAQTTIANLAAFRAALTRATPGICATAAATTSIGVFGQAPEDVEDVVSGFVSSGEVAGAAVVVASAEGVLQRVALGYANLESRTPMHLDTPFAVSSLSKPFVATAAMVLVEAGRLSLDEQIGRYIPELRDLRLLNGRSPVRGPTLRDLLRHTSGLLDHRLDLRVEALHDFVRRAAREPLHFEPGTRWGYSSAGLMVAAHVVQSIGGASIEHLLREAVWAPLGMRDTSFLLTEARELALARLYPFLTHGEATRPVSLPDDIIIGGRDLATISPTRGLFSTAEDLAIFCRMLLCGGALGGQTILSLSTVETMISLSTGDLTAGFVPGMGWALGWAVVRERGFDPCLSVGTFGHAGSRGQQMWVGRRDGLIRILLMQRDGIHNVEGSALHLDVERAITRRWQSAR